MKYEMYATQDTITGHFKSGIDMYNNQAEAKRAWGGAIAHLSKNNPDRVPIKDFKLYRLGTFDTQTGVIESNVEFIAAAQEFMES